MSTLQRTHIPTLFPYTTLFRSADHRPPAQPGEGQAQAQVQAALGHAEALVFLDHLVDARAVPGEAVECFLGVGGSVLDRKSTRLNSSHLVISYAVFCWKKKKKNHTKMDIWRRMSETANRSNKIFATR